MSDLMANPLAQAAFLIGFRILLRVLFGKKGSAVRLVVNFGFFLLLTTILLMAGHVPFAAEPRGDDVRLAILLDLIKATWWVAGANVIVSGVRLFLIFEGNPREGRLLQDLVVAVVYIGTFLSISAYVFGIPVGTLIATSGAFAIILGLALQSTLNDLFSGVALKLGRPYAIGDWIVLDSATQGKVVETNWRSTHLVNGANDLVVIPNSALAKARFTNLSSPSPTHGRRLSIRVAMRHSPATIEAILRTALTGSNLISKDPPPSTCVVGLTEEAVEIELNFSVPALAIGDAAQSEIFDLLYRHLKASGLSIAREPGFMPRPETAHFPKEGRPSTAWSLLNAINLFSSLTDEERTVLSQSMARLTFRQGSVIAGVGSTMGSLYIVRSGIATVERGGQGQTHELRRLSPGDFVGEKGVLMGAPEPATVRALTFVVVYEIPKDRIAALLRERPAIADELGEILSQHMASESEALSPTHRDHRAVTLSQKIRNLLHTDVRQNF